MIAEISNWHRLNSAGKGHRPVCGHAQSDLFTTVYFMSEIFKLRAEAESFFDQLFANSKQGALFLYVDNNYSTLYDYFDSILERHALRILESAALKKMDIDEERTDLGIYYTKFGYPKLEAGIAYRICQKQ